MKFWYMESQKPTRDERSWVIGMAEVGFLLALMIRFTNKGTYHPFAHTLTSSHWNQIFGESVDLMVYVAMVSRGENKDWICPWMTFYESPKITVDTSSYMHSLLFRYLDWNQSCLRQTAEVYDIQIDSNLKWLCPSFNKLFPRIPPLPPKTQFIKIKFVNQGLDA